MAATKTKQIRYRATVNVPKAFQQLTPGELAEAFQRALEQAGFEIVRASAKQTDPELD